ncbi:hypothetical protein MTIM_01770 [Mycobacterium timonense]|uniref:Uncharacterized protein n=1 Tax=Mycobacterium timonense TaxID=701043 RepID=A0A7I9Z0A5_9MYCO|nr:hypothetical protein MTIM_01770 [Mycobacterium timonense]
MTPSAAANTTAASALPCLSSFTDLAFMTTFKTRVGAAGPAHSNVSVARTRLTIRVNAARTRGQLAAGVTAYAVSTL